MSNPNSRLEAFCDGVFAIALTLLIIEVKVPHVDPVNSAADLWHALGHIWLTLFAFLLSFGIILITWVNHHATLKLIDKTSAPFMYANGYLLLTIVVLPFPTALMSEYGLTKGAAPSVVLYAGVNFLQGIAWFLISRVSLKGLLTKNEKATEMMKDIHKRSYFAMAIYFLCTIAAFWFPLTIAISITAIWIVWLSYGINIKEEKG